MKRILCFGDSNTWGYKPGTGSLTRYDEQTRWTALLQQKLTGRAQVLEFGLCGCESGGWGKHMPFNADARTLFPPVLFASLPVDLAIIMLGSNDIKTKNGWKPGDTAANLRALFPAARALCPSLSFVLAPAVQLDMRASAHPDYSDRAVEDSRLCALEVEQLAKEEGLPFFDTNAYAGKLGADGIHFTAEGHAAFAAALATFLEEQGLL